MPKSETLEAVKRGGFRLNEQYEIHWCEQFFTPPSHASQFVTNVIDAAKSGWDTLVTSGYFPAPHDPDSCRIFFINEGTRSSLTRNQRPG